MTSYTPYQPEVAQGVLQAVFEFQTLVARLAGVPIANASLYDGAAALVEAVNLGVAATGRQDGVAVARRQPDWRAVLADLRRGHRPPICATCRCATGPPTGRPRRSTTAGDPGVVVVAYPNYLGCLEDLAEARAVCDRSGALLVVAFDPVCAGVLRSAGGAGGPTWWWGRARPSACPSASAVRTSGCSPAPPDHVRRLPGPPRRARRSTPRDGAPT